MIRLSLARRRGLVEKRMFGGICWMLNGNMLCGIAKDSFMFRVGRELEAEALARPGTRIMDFTGKPMRGFVLVDPDAAEDAGLEAWIAFAARYVAALPPKAPKALSGRGKG
ncbi:TfoX/Sxy family protein [Falsiroseomonas bella]|nr:TfoX/Sxy family protein [Falsiroseomonas bella]